ncbi:MAG: DNA-binding protein [Ignisphaera sp.]
MNSEVYIFDTAAFLSALQLYIYRGEIVTTPSVVKEVKDSESIARLDVAAAVDRFHVEEPSARYIEEAKSIAKRMNLYGELSETDIEVLALAIEYRSRGRRPIVFTDDYDMQKILKTIGIEFRSIKNLGIHSGKRI